MWLGGSGFDGGDKVSGKQRSIWIEDEMWQRIRQLAFDRGCSCAEAVRYATKEYLLHEKYDLDSPKNNNRPARIMEGD